MALFKVTQFDSNNVADKACKEIFKTSFTTKNRVQMGKITKSKKKKQIKKNKIKQEGKAILQNDGFKKSIKVKTKNEKVKFPNEFSKMTTEKHKNRTGNAESEKVSHNTKNKQKNKQKKAKTRSFTQIENGTESKMKIKNKLKKKQIFNENEPIENLKKQKRKENLGYVSKIKNKSASSPTFKHRMTEKFTQSKTNILVRNQTSNTETLQSQKKRKRKQLKPALENDQENTSESTVLPTYGINKRKKLKENLHHIDTLEDDHESTSESAPLLTYANKKREKLKERLHQMVDKPEAKPKTTKSKNLSLRERMLQKLQSARFRYINEQIYSTDSRDAQKLFSEDSNAFKAYHEGYRQQVNKWPLNPLDIVIKSVQKLPKTHIIADFGCGDAKLAQSVNQQVHSFDLVAVNDLVQSCDMAHVPLDNSSVDVVVFCLSLMGTNLHDYILEANRVLKVGGILKIAEIESRFDDVKQFIEGLQRFNFKNTWNDLTHNLFYFLDFKKEANIKNKKKLPTLSLHPCLYKKR